MFWLLRPHILPKSLGVNGFESSCQNGLQKVSFCPLNPRTAEYLEMFLKNIFMKQYYPSNN